MKQVQVFRKTLLSVAVATALGGYGTLSYAAIDFKNLGKDEVVKESVFDSYLEEANKHEDVKDKLFKESSSVKNQIKEFKDEFAKITGDDEDAKKKRRALYDAFATKLKLHTQFFKQPKGQDSKDGEPKKGETKRKLVKEVQPGQKADWSAHRSGKKSSSLDGSKYGLHTKLGTAKDADALKELRDKKLEKFLELSGEDLEKLVMVDRPVKDSEGKVTDTQPGAPDTIVLKGFDFTDKEVREKVLGHLRTHLKDVFGDKDIQFKTATLNASGLVSGFKDGEALPDVSYSGEGTDPAGSYVVTGKSSVTHESVSKARALEALVVEEGSSLRVKKGEQIRATHVLLDDADTVGAYSVETKGEGEKQRQVLKEEVVEIIGVLPAETELKKKVKKDGEEVEQAYARVKTVFESKAKQAHVTLKGFEDVSFTGTKVRTEGIGGAAVENGPVAKNVTFKDSKVLDEGVAGITGQHVVFDGSSLMKEEVEEFASKDKGASADSQDEKKKEGAGSEGAKNDGDKPKGDSGKKAEASKKVVKRTHIRESVLQGANQQVEMYESEDGFEDDSKTRRTVMVDVDDVLDIQNGSKVVAAVKDYEIINLSDSELISDSVGSAAKPVKAFNMKGKAKLHRRSNEGNTAYYSKETPIVLTEGQEIVSDVHGFRSFVLDGGTFEGNLKGFEADPADMELEKGQTRFDGSTVVLTSGVFKGGEIGSEVDGELGPVKSITINGRVEIKPGVTTLTALDENGKPQVTELKQAGANAPVIITKDGNPVLFKTFKRSTSQDGKQSKVVEPTLVSRNGMTMEKGGRMTVVVDFDDASIDKVPYATVEGGLKLEGQNAVAVEIAGVESSQRHELKRALYKESEDPKAAARKVAVMLADSVEGKFDNPITGDDFLAATSKGFVSTDEGQLYSLEFKYQAPSVDFLKSKYGMSTNQAKLYIAGDKAANTAIMPVGEAMSATYALVQQQGHQKQFAEDMEQDTHNGAGRAAVTLTQKVNQSISRHLNSNRTGISTGDMFESQGFWGEYIMSSGEQDNKDGVKGYEAKVNGINLGVDSMLNDQLTVGFAFTYGDLSVETNDVSRESSGDAFMGTLYTGWTQDDFFFDTMFSYGRSSNEYKRKSRDENFTYKGDADSTIMGARFVAGYNYQVNQWLIQPQAEFNYTKVDFDDMKEKGEAGANFAQNVSIQEFEVMELGAGLKIMGEFEAGNGMLQPEFTLMGYHDFKDKEGEAVVTFQNGSAQPVTLLGAERDQNRFLAGLGVRYTMANNLSFGLNYDYNWLGDYKAHGLNASIRYDF